MGSYVVSCRLAPQYRLIIHLNAPMLERPKIRENEVIKGYFGCCADSIDEQCDGLAKGTY
jgi:hypothetical protein